MRIALLGNAGGGKSTLARRLALRHGIPLYEVDRFLWRPGWQLAPEAEHQAEHDRIVEQPVWLIEGLGRLKSIASRIQGATTVILVDLPLWQHFWLSAERQLAWTRGDLQDRPAGASEMPPTRALFETIWTVDREWMPKVRALVSESERAGTDVRRITDVDELDRFDL